MDGARGGYALAAALKEMTALNCSKAGVEETAETLGLKPETVKTRLFRARQLFCAIDSRRKWVPC